MNAVGIDVSKGKSMVAVLDSNGVSLVKPFSVNHSVSDLANLADFLSSLPGVTKIVMEHTGRYYEAIARFLHERGFFVYAVNPLLIRAYSGNSLRRVKTDKADALKIAKYTLDNHSDLRQFSSADSTRYALKVLNRQFQLVSKNRTAFSCNLIALLDLSFPGLRELFNSHVRSDGRQKWVDFARSFYHVDCVRTYTLAAFTKRYAAWCKRNNYNFSESKAVRIHAHAKDMIPLMPKSATTKLLIQQSADLLTNLSCTAEKLRAEMNCLAALLPEYPVVMGMCGVGPSTGPQLIAEIGDVRRFAHKQSLVAFAGVDPLPNQSGMMNVRSTKTSKRGSPFLRKTLFNIMSILLQKAPPMIPYFSSSIASAPRASPTTST